MAAFGGIAAVMNLVLGGLQAVLPILVWGVVCVVGIIIVTTHPRETKEGK